MADFFEAINEAAPDAIARMLQAGAAGFIRDTEAEGGEEKSSEPNHFNAVGK